MYVCLSCCADVWLCLCVYVWLIGSMLYACVLYVCARLHVCGCTGVYNYVCMCVCGCLHVCAYACMPVCIYDVCQYVYMCAGMDVCV